MKRSSSLALVSLAALVACGQQDDADNRAAAPDNVAVVPEEVVLNDVSTVEQPNTAEPVQRPPDAELSIPPVKPKAPEVAPKPTPPPPTSKPDPHASHDMANMSHNAQ